jgi:hypothetical protein
MGLYPSFFLDFTLKQNSLPGSCVWDFTNKMWLWRNPLNNTDTLLGHAGVPPLL